MFQKILMLLQLTLLLLPACMGFLGPLPHKGNVYVCSCGVLSELYSVSPLSLISLQLGVREEEEEH